MTEVLHVDDVLEHLHRGVRHAKLSTPGYAATIASIPPAELLKYVRADIAVCGIQRLAGDFEREAGDKALTPRARAIARTASAMLVAYIAHICEFVAVEQAA